METIQKQALEERGGITIESIYKEKEVLTLEKGKRMYVPDE